jgi:Flp pilus assembly protein TadD
MDNTTKAAPRTASICVGLVALTLAAFWPVVRNGFVSFDDTAYITENGRVLAGLNWDNVRWAFGTVYFGNWHPLTWLSLMFDVELFGLDPAFHHLHSLLLHAASVVLLFLALKRMTGATWPSALVAAFFAVHPLRVESVAWAAERKDVLSVFFGMLSLWAYARYVEQSKVQSLKPKVGDAEPKVGATGVECRVSGAGVHNPESEITEHGTPNTHHFSSFKFQVSRFYLLSLLFFALSLMSKAMLVTLPFVLLLLDFWPLERFEIKNQKSKIESCISLPPLRLLFEKLPFFAMSALSTVVGFSAMSDAGGFSSYPRFGLGYRLAHTVWGYLGYLGKLVLPVNLALPYPPPARLGAGQIALAVSILGFVSLGALLLLRRRPYLAVGWFWFLGVLFPVSTVVRSGLEDIADRYTYFASIGFFIALTWGLIECTKESRCLTMTARFLAVAALGACLQLSNLQVTYWRDSERLYRHALSVSPNSFVAHNGLGSELFKQGKVDDAIQQCQTAVEIEPGYDPAHSNLGRFFAAKKDYESAIAHFELALKLSPRDPHPRNNFGNVLFLLGRNEEALAQFAEVVRLDPNHAEAHNNLALACRRLGRTAEAIPHFRQAIQLKPDFAAAFNNLAWILATHPDAQFRNGPEAVQLATRACELTRYEQPVVLATLAAAYAETGRFPEAVSFAERAQERAGSGQNEVTQKLSAMLVSFRAGQPYHAD